VSGASTIDHAGHLVGDGFAVQANMMASPDVWPAMAEAYGAHAGTAVEARSGGPAGCERERDEVAWPFARRLLTVLEAGQAAGGDARGVMSAALLVVAADPAEPWAGRLVDLRVDRSQDPLGELRHLLDAAEAYDGFGRAVDALAGGDARAALDAADHGLALLPGEQNLRFIRSGALAASGDEEAGLAALRALIDDRPSWAVVVGGFAAKGLLPLPARAAAPPTEP
jgi:uncharacterized Ntn-hydrolase superfamily protein